MKNFNFTSQVCTSTEQSKRLLDLGLKSETADMCIDLYYEDEPFVVHNNKTDYSKQIEFVPAWSLHRLIELLPDKIEDYGVDVIKSFGNISCIYDKIIYCIEWLISKGYFNKEYLKQ